MEKGQDLLFITLYNCRAGCISEVTPNLISEGNTSLHRPQDMGEVLKQNQRSRRKYTTWCFYSYQMCENPK